ncbi:MAG: hypothetical protein H0X30_00255 [Anaerolineae bacterium]|nr:hypothetical protein [Anaerolineae bacterium]
MTQTTFTDNVLVDGSQDIKQLRVQGHTTQTQQLQTWEDSAGNAVAQITGDGRLIVGDDDATAQTPDSLLEAHRFDTSTSKPKRGIHSLGQVTGTLNALMQWMVGELELTGASAISALHTALRIRISNKSTVAASAGAELRGGDIEVINDTLANGAALPQATGVQVTVTNAAAKVITTAIGLKVKMNNAGTITNPFSIYTEGPGVVHLEDYIEIKRPTASPGTPATDFIRVYPGPDGKLYAKNWNGTESPLGGSGAALGSSFCARLTPVTGVGVPTADATAVTQVFLTPFNGNLIGVYDGTVTQNYVLPSDISIKLTDTQTVTTTNANNTITGLADTSQLIVGMKVTGTGIAANSVIASISSSTSVTLNNNATASGTVSITFKVAANTMLDIFTYVSSGSLKLEMAAWTNTSTRATALTTQDGYLVKTGALTRRFVGCVLTTVTDGQTERSHGTNNAGSTTASLGGKCYIVNYYNPLPWQISFFDITNHAYTTASWRQWLANTNARCGFISPLGADDVIVGVSGQFQVQNTQSCGIGACLNTATRAITDPQYFTGAANINTTINAGAAKAYATAVGYNYAAALEYGQVSDSHQAIQVSLAVAA